MTQRWPTLVIGGSGYVAGELMRLSAGHPDLDLAAVVSSTLPGQRIDHTFPHLAPITQGLRFSDLNEALGKLNKGDHWAVLSAAPHGISAGLLSQVVAAAETTGARLSIVDASADFRYGSASAFEAVYGQSHGAPDLLDSFCCAIPEHTASISAPHVAHPGCFATAMLLGIVPLAASGWVDDRFYVTGITGSTGSGRAPTATTHHPERQSNLFAYKALAHRHDPEVRSLTRSVTGKDIQLHFVPHSGPFARGIHATIQTPLKEPVDAKQLHKLLSDYYQGAHFVTITRDMPRLKDVAGSNYAALGVAVDKQTAVVVCVIDNLLKGAAGGAVQWLNRLIGVPQQRGLEVPAMGWL